MFPTHGGVSNVRTYKMEDGDLFFIDSSGDSTLLASLPSQPEPALARDDEFIPFSSGSSRRQKKQNKRNNQNNQKRKQKNRAPAVYETDDVDMLDGAFLNRPRHGRGNHSDGPSVPVAGRFSKPVTRKEQRKRRQMVWVNAQQQQEQHLAGGSEGGRSGEGEVSGDEDAEDEEDNAAILDYIENSFGNMDLSALSNMSALASLNLSDAEGGLGSSGDEQNGRIENGYYDDVMHLEDEDSEDDSSDGSDSELEFAGLDLGADGRRPRKNPLLDDGSEDDPLTDYGGGYSDEEDAIRAEFEGGRSTWEDGGATRASEAKFHMILRSEFGGAKGRGVGADNIPFEKPGKAKRRKMAKEAVRAKRAEKADAAISRAEAGRRLQTSLAKSKGNTTPAIAAFLKRENKAMRDFVLDPNMPPSTILSPMPGAVRRIVQSLAVRYHLKPKTRGAGKRKVTVMFRTGQSSVPANWADLVDIALEREGGRFSAPTSSPPQGNGQRKGKGKGGKKETKGRKGPPGEADTSARPRIGDVVGSSAAPIGSGNIGHRMMLSMGWSVGQGLGAEGAGIVNPVEVLVRSKRSGLGNVL
ncbi:squalene synthetase-like protein [Borealophlyctis nickersoniae]|nr:squalene synthetase-like protein [Borealophlyctis nickersoniae]